MISQITVLFGSERWRVNVTSRITKCRSNHRRDHNILEWESKFTLGLNAATNTDYIKKCFQQKLFRIKFPRKNLVDAYLYLPQKWNYGAPKIVTFEIESRITLKLNAAENTDYIRKCVKKLFEIKFPSKNSVGTYLYLAKEWS